MESNSGAVIVAVAGAGSTWLKLRFCELVVLWVECTTMCQDGKVVPLLTLPIVNGECVDLSISSLFCRGPRKKEEKGKNVQHIHGAPHGPLRSFLVSPSAGLFFPISLFACLAPATQLPD